ncbi:stationary-phase-induced ribosome-associated protein [Escherichia coli]|nr:stationary-phase-induced ribosome-associated protein [Escherichia coli]
MKSNRQARHILGLDHKISNQRKIVTEGDKSSVVNPAENAPLKSNS